VSLDKGTIIGLGVCVVGLGGGAIVESGGIAIIFALINIPAFMIVVLGTLGATAIAFPLERVMQLPKIIAIAFRQPVEDEKHVVSLFVRLAERARREGLLALEGEAAEIEDPFIKKGILLAVDGTDPELVREIMESDVAGMTERHEARFGMLEAMGAFGPTMGIIGTVMGLINVLSHLDNPDGLGHSIAVAFIATLYGVGTANVLWLPMGGRLKQRHKEEASTRQLAIEGVMAVQAGDNPRVVRDKLEAFLPPHMRGEDEPSGIMESSGAGNPVAAAA
jgi:chemotaxis protein MotA